jgi:hypothetical protein
VYQGPRGSCLMKKTRGRKSRVRVPLTINRRFCYVVYNSRKSNGFNNCTLWSIIVVIERREVFGSATHALASWKVKILHENTIFTVEPRRRIQSEKEQQERGKLNSCCLIISVADRVQIFLEEIIERRLDWGSPVYISWCYCMGVVQYHLAAKLTFSAECYRSDWGVGMGS